MQAIHDGTRIPILNWAEGIDDTCRSQATNLANLPFARGTFCLMPDAHGGYGMPIGGVVACKGVIIPNAVGVDIGCGMAAAITTLDADLISRDELKRVMGLVREAVPVGKDHHKMAQAIPWGKEVISQATHPVVWDQWLAMQRQIGTLGGGNHFIEFQRSDNGYLVVMVHSGSRNLGKRVCDYHNDVAKKLNARWHSAVPAEHDLAFLPVDSEDGQWYIAEMNFCLDFARENRARIIKAITDVLALCLPPHEFLTMDTMHNYAAQEGKCGYWIHRKGAVRARAGERVLIPGSQGTASYISEGLGNEDSMNSCSHGSGRRLGRKEAARTLDLADQISKMDALGIVHGIRNVSDLDEAPDAYKDIDRVMELQSDLVKPITKLIPMGVIKGN